MVRLLCLSAYIRHSGWIKIIINRTKFNNMKTIRQSVKAIFLLSIMTVMFSPISLAQEQFRLSDYKNPDYKWKRLDLRFWLGGDNRFYKQEIEYGTSEKQKQYQMNSNLSADYYATKNSRSYQGYQNFRLSGNINANNFSDLDLNENLENTTKGNSQGVLLMAQTENRFYNANNRFIETDLDFTGQLNNSTAKYSDDLEIYPFNYENTSYSHYVTASLPMLIGTGRIEDVQDARLAVYILDDLTKAGDLKRIPTSEEILEFSRFITSTKNQRFFDVRIRKIAEITAIDSFLTVLDLKAQSDASYFTLVYDNWDNSFGPVRKTGGRFYVGLMPEIDLSFHNYQEFYYDTLDNSEAIEDYTNKNTTQDDSWNMDVVTGYVWEKPASLSWQHSVITGVAYSLYYKQMNSKVYDFDTLTSEQSSRLNSPNIRFDVGYTIGYYPNSRTSIKLGMITSYNQFWGEEKETDMADRDAGKIIISNDLNLTCYYYISQQVRLSVNISSKYLFNKQNQVQPLDESGYEITHNLQNSFGASLTYSIF